MRLTLIAAFVALQLSDVITTQAILSRGGGESNPLVFHFMQTFGESWWIPKLCLAVVAGTIVAFGNRRYIVALVALMTFVVMNNEVVLAHLQ
jgi:hypothetical protein